MKINLTTSIIEKSFPTKDIKHLHFGLSEDKTKVELTVITKDDRFDLSCDRNEPEKVKKLFNFRTSILADIDLIIRLKL